MSADSLESWAPVLREYDPLLAGSIDGTLQVRNIVGDTNNCASCCRHFTTESCFLPSECLYPPFTVTSRTRANCVYILNNYFDIKVNLEFVSGLFLSFFDIM